MLAGGLLLGDRHHMILAGALGEEVKASAILTLKLRYMLVRAVRGLHQLHVTVALVLRLIICIELVIEVGAAVRAAEHIGRRCCDDSSEAAGTILTRGRPAFIRPKEERIWVVHLLDTHRPIWMQLIDLLASSMLLAELVDSILLSRAAISRAQPLLAAGIWIVELDHLVA